MEPVHTLISGAVARLVRPAPLSAEKVLFAWRATVGPAVARVTRVRFAGLGVIEVIVGAEHEADIAEFGRLHRWRVVARPINGIDAIDGVGEVGIDH